MNDAFLSRFGYRHDLFVSYSHGDINGADDSLLSDWSQDFVALLSKFLTSVLKKPVSIYLDVSRDPLRRVNPMSPLDEQLAEAINKSALLQVMMSPEYLNSCWCTKELEHWIAGQAAKRGGPQDRIAIARVWKTKHEDWPSAFKDQGGDVLPGFWFHDRQEEAPWGFGCRFSGVPGNHEDFQKEILKMANTLRLRLVALVEEIELKEGADVEVEKLQAGNAAIYLYARQEHSDQWRSTSADIQRLSLQVRPGEPDPPDVDEDARKRKELAGIASRCQAMLLIGVDGLALDADLDVVGYDRRNFVQSCYQKALPCAVVDRLGSLGTPARKAYASGLQIDWLNGSGADWPGNLDTWLKERASVTAADGYGVSVK